jgi:urea transporter
MGLDFHHECYNYHLVGEALALAAPNKHWRHQTTSLIGIVVKIVIVQGGVVVLVSQEHMEVLNKLN